MEQIRDVDPATIESNEGNEIEKAVRALLAQAVTGALALEKRAKTAVGTAKAGGEFTFGDQADFVGGLQGQIGLPNGLDEKQWLESVEAEHCSVDAGVPDSQEWGASDRFWQTGNYNLTTCPGDEYRCVCWPRLKLCIVCAVVEPKHTHAFRWARFVFLNQMC